VKYEKLKTKLLKDPDVRKAHRAMAPEFALARELIAARTRAGFTQAELAARMGTSQSAVARMESGRLPSIKSLLRYAKAIGAKPVIKLVKCA
jgi:predicted transcriptional regulator